MAKKYGWNPKFPGQPYFTTGLMRRNGSSHQDRMERSVPGELKPHRVWHSTDRAFGTPTRGVFVLNGRETWYKDDPFGRLCPPRLRARLVLPFPHHWRT